MGLPEKGFKKRTLVIAAFLVLAAAGAVRNELLGAVIRAVPTRADDPLLTIRFAVFNPAFTVTLRDVDMTCIPLSLSGHDKAGHAWTMKAAPFPLNVNMDVGPRMAFEYTCPIEVKTPAPPQSVTVEIDTRFTRFGRRQRGASGMLAWDSASRVWTKTGS